MPLQRREVLILGAAFIPGSAQSRGREPFERPGQARFAFQQVNVFSPTPLRGNPLAVVVGADSLGSEQMAAFANWTNLSESAFLLRPTDPAADYRVRIFTPDRELAFAAGHPTLGSCYAWLAAGGIARGGELVQQCAASLTRIRKGPDRLSFLAAKLIRSGSVEADVLARVARGLHLAPEAIIASNWVDNGPGWLAVMLRTRQEVLALHPDYPLMAGLHVGVVAPWSPEDGPDAQFEVRAFSAGGGGFEDPVTGSLNAGLAVWLIESGRAPPAYVASQGTVIGRSGRVLVEKRGPEIWIGGAVTPCIEGIVIV